MCFKALYSTALMFQPMSKHLEHYLFIYIFVYFFSFSSSYLSSSSFSSKASFVLIYGARQRRHIFKESVALDRAKVSLSDCVALDSTEA